MKFGDIVLLGFLPNDLHSIFSTFNIALESYLNHLPPTMKKMCDSFSRAKEFYGNDTIVEKILHKYEKIISDYPIYWEHNYNLFFRDISPLDLRMTYAIDYPQPINSQYIHFYTFPPECQSNSLCYGSFEQVISHLKRDWGKDGQDVREKLYNRILRSLATYSEPKGRVLVPGCGLARLSLEILRLGYRVESNECSGLMISVFFGLMKLILLENRDLNLYSNLHHSWKDSWNISKLHEIDQFPSVDSASLISWLQNTPSPSIVFQFGSFVDIYSHSYLYSTFDTVVTCFFIDALPNTVNTLKIIFNLLKPGGIWINAGPLHYHSIDDFQFSHQDIVEIVSSLGFEAVEEEVIESTYCGEQSISMKPEYYRIPLTVWRKVL